MSEISKAAKNDLYTHLREAAIVIDEARHATELTKDDDNFIFATGIVRGLRRAVEASEDRRMVIWRVEEFYTVLGLIGGKATDAVHAARRLIADAHHRLASGPE